MGTLEDSDMDDYQFPLPGFRFHPTDEELVDYYLRRKVEKKSIAIDELIKQIDIYKHNPWDLPHGIMNGTIMGEKLECYVFVKRGRKYKNSARPNRVIAGSGFWKATGIDKPIYSRDDSDQTMGFGIGRHYHRCIGLKKTLVYYRGTAGRGVKTEWMMHEFRLPPSTAYNSHSTDHFSKFKTNAAAATAVVEEAEIWTLCRIFKRSVVSCKRYTPSPIPAGKAGLRPDPEPEVVDHGGHYGEMKTKKYSTNGCTVGRDVQSATAKYISFSSASTPSSSPPSISFDPFDHDHKIIKKAPLSSSSIIDDDFDPIPIPANKFIRKNQNQWSGEYSCEWKMKKMMNSRCSSSITHQEVSPALSINDDVSPSPASSSFCNLDTTMRMTDDLFGTDQFKWDYDDELRSLAEFAFDPLSHSMISN